MHNVAACCYRSMQELKSPEVFNRVRQGLQHDVLLAHALWGFYLLRKSAALMHALGSNKRAYEAMLAWKARAVSGRQPWAADSPAACTRRTRARAPAHLPPPAVLRLAA